MLFSVITLSYAQLRSCCILALIMLFTCSGTVLSQQPTSQQTQGGQGQRYGDPNFEGEKINLNVVNADIRDILNYITEQYGVNFVIDKSVKQVPVTVNVSDVPWNVALNSILQANGLGIDINGNILRVADATVLAQEASVRQQIAEAQLNTSPLYTEFIRLNYARAAGTLAQAAGSSGGFAGGTVGGPSGGAGGDSTGGGGDAGILPIIKRRLSRRGAIEIDGRSNTLIVTDVRQNIDSIRQLIALLDQPEPQVEIEARIVIASRNFSRDLGVQLSALVLGTNGKAASIATAQGSQATGGGGAGGNTTGLRPTGIPVGVGRDPNGSLGAASPNTVIGLTTGIFGTAQISALITAAEQKGQVKTIATPRVTTLNNRPAQIESGTQIAVDTIQQSTGGGGALPPLTTTFVSVPLRLSVTPQITDAGTVVLRVVAENNSINPSLAAGRSGTPGINSQRMQTEVLVPDGGTTVVGGAVLDNEAETRFRTPGLASVPLVGNLFKRRQTTRSTDEILFFITPRIYRPDFEGNLTPGKVSDTTRSTTIIQPVPLGNPASNSDVPGPQVPRPSFPGNIPGGVQQPVQPIIVPTQPEVQPQQSQQQQPAAPQTQTRQP